MKRQLYPSWHAIALALLLAAGGQLCTAQPAYAHIKQVSRPNESQPKTISLKEALRALKGYYGVDIVFGDQTVDPYTITTDLVDYKLSVEKNLSNVLRPSGLKYRRMKNGSYAIISKKTDERATEPAQSPVDIPSNTGSASGRPNENNLVATVSSAPTVRKVTGEVVDEKGEALPGVSIIIKGKTRGTVTDPNGRFSIETDDEGETLIFSYVGYLTQEVEPGTSTNLRVILEVDNKLLEEVVVVGYGTQKKANMTGAVSTVNFESEAINSRAVTNVSTMLAGMSAGIRVQQVNGLPSDNNNSSINVRGVGSLNSSSAPLVVIDGQVADINSVSPNDVASVTILKDAASAAIYGSRASNGVILITTKKGMDTQGKVTFNYNNYIGMKTPAQVANLVDNAPDYMRLVNMMRQNSGLAEKFSQDYIEEWREGSKTDPIKYPNTNWLTALIKPNTVMNHNFSARGGNDKINFYSSVDYFGDDGLVPNTGFQRINFRNTISYKVSKWLKFGNTFTVISTKAEPATIENGFLWMRATTPAVVPKHPDGRYGSGQLLAGEGGQNNGLQNVENRRGETKGTQLQGKIFAVLTPLNGLNITASYFSDLRLTEAWGGDIFTDQWNFNTDKVGIDRTSGSRFSISNSSRRNQRQIYDLYADYAKSLGNHNFQALAGFNQEYYATSNFRASRSDLLSYDTPVLDAAASDPQASGNASDFSLRSLFGRFAYNYKGKYLLETNLRYDGSSRFAPDKRWGLFPSVSAGWMISAEDFWEPLGKVVNDFKIRASWGQLGNNGIGDYEWQEFYSASNYNFGGNIVQGLTYSSFGNPQITWETTNVLNIGADIRLFNTLNLDINYYNKRTDNILANLPIPLVNGGIGAPRVNAAEVQNKGLEAEARYLLNLGKFSFNLAGNLGYNKNKILKYKGDLIEPRGESQAWTEGYPIGVYWVREIDQVIQDPSVVEALVAEGITFHPSTPGVGDFLYRNANGDKFINDNDRVLKGNPIPLFTYGGNVGMKYGGFDLNVFLDGVANWDRYLRGTLYALNHQEAYQWPQEYLNAWTEQNPSTTIPRVYFTNPRNDQVSDYFIRSAAYLKIRSIQLGYTLSPTLTHAIRMEKLRVFANLENYFTFTKWPTLDPEVTVGEADQTYPLSKTFSMGISISF